MRGVMWVWMAAGCGVDAPSPEVQADAAARRNVVNTVVFERQLSRDLAEAVARIQALEQQNAALQAQLDGLGEVFISPDDDDYGEIIETITSVQTTSSSTAEGLASLQTVFDDMDIDIRLDTLERGIGGPLFVDDADFVPLLDELGYVRELVVADDADIEVLATRVGLIEGIVADDDVDDALLIERIGGLELIVADDDADDLLFAERLAGIDGAIKRDDADDLVVQQRIGDLEGAVGTFNVDDFDGLAGRVGLLEDGVVQDDADDELLWGRVGDVENATAQTEGRVTDLERTVGGIIEPDDVDTLPITERLTDVEAQATWLEEQVTQLWQAVFGPT